MSYKIITKKKNQFDQLIKKERNVNSSEMISFRKDIEQNGNPYESFKVFNEENKVVFSNKDLK